MTNSSDNRIDRIEALLEVFTTTSNERMSHLEQSMTVNSEQSKVTDERLNQMSEKTDVRFNQLVTEADANREITFMMLE